MRQHTAGIAAVVAVGMSLTLAGCGSTPPTGSSGSSRSSRPVPSAGTSTDDVTQDLNSALSSAGNAAADANSAQQAANTPDNP